MHNTEALFAFYKTFAERIAASYGDNNLVSQDEKVSVALRALYSATQSYDSSLGLFEPHARAIIREELAKVAEHKLRNNVVISTSKQPKGESETIPGTPEQLHLPEHCCVLTDVNPEEQTVPRLSSLSERARRFIELFKKGYDVSVISQILDEATHKEITPPKSERPYAICYDEGIAAQLECVTIHPAENTTEFDSPPFLSLNHASRIIPGDIYDDFTHYRGENGESNYPPDWDARRAKALDRDGFRCQVTGCPNLEGLDVHHMEMITRGGSHALDNLTCLCIVHHWMLPDHDLVRERSQEEKMLRRFTMRRAHWRCANGNQIKVRATFERYVRCSVSDCESIRDTYDLRCPMCESDGIQFAIFGDDLVAGCLGCRSAWKLRCLLAEETGTLLASIFRHPEGRGGTFAFDLDHLPDKEVEETVLCNKCADFARIGIFVSRNGAFGRFHGCTNYGTHQCRNSRERQGV